MRAEFEIDEEKKPPIGTCAVQGKVFKPIIQEGLPLRGPRQRQNPVSVPRLEIPRNWELTSRKPDLLAKSAHSGNIFFPYAVTYR
jgi:hypothetical protein